MEHPTVLSHHDPALALRAEDAVSWNPPAELQAFLCDRVQSLQALEVLRLLAAPPRRWWFVTDVSRELGAADWIVEDAIQTLVEARLLSGTEKQAKFAHEPGSHVHDLVQQSLAAYIEHRAEVVRLLNSRAVTRVRVRLDALTNELLGKQVRASR